MNLSVVFEVSLSEFVYCRVLLVSYFIGVKNISTILGLKSIFTIYICSLFYCALHSQFSEFGDLLPNM